ncbi:hypothetical protein V6O07_00475 [Arthrospira platensis SPKY2]
MNKALKRGLSNSKSSKRTKEKQDYQEFLASLSVEKKKEMERNCYDSVVHNNKFPNYQNRMEELFYKEYISSALNGYYDYDYDDNLVIYPDVDELPPRP